MYVLLMLTTKIMKLNTQFIIVLNTLAQDFALY